MLPSPVVLLPLLLTTALLPSTALGYIVTQSISDQVSAGDVVYYTLESSKLLLVVLISQEGDADLYASPTYQNSNPSCENNELSSASCGLDVVPLFMSNNLRKYTLGVFGHVRYDKTKYKLFIIEPDPEDTKRYQVTTQ